MESFTTYILTSLALLFVIEGLIYALFTEAVRKMMAMALQMDASILRNFGMIMATIGLALIWVIWKF